MVNRIRGMLDVEPQRMVVSGTPEEQLEIAMQRLESSARLTLVGAGGPEQHRALIRHLFAVKAPEPLPSGHFELRITLFGVEFKSSGQLTAEQAQTGVHVRRALERVVQGTLSAIGDFARQARGSEAERRRNLQEGPHGKEGHEEGGSEGVQPDDREEVDHEGDRHDAAEAVPGEERGLEQLEQLDELGGDVQPPRRPGGDRTGNPGGESGAGSE